MRWAGADVVLGPLIEPGNPLAERFELRDLTLVRRVEHDGDVVTGVTVEDLRTQETSFVPADLVVVAADAFRSPQLLWASGIRPRALGHYLTEHPVVISTVALDAEKIGRFATEEQLDEELARRATNPADPVAAVNRIPFSEPDHPFSLQVMYSETTPFPMEPDAPYAQNRWGYVNMGYGMRKFPRFEDAVTFDDDELDYRGFPNMTITYELTPSGARRDRRPPPSGCAGRATRSAPSSPSRASCRTARACTTRARCAWATPTTAPRSPTRGRASGATRTSSSAATPSSRRPRR